MELLSSSLDLLLHLDRDLEWLVHAQGSWVYAILFLIVFCETGLVVTPFLPGDSLLFVAGTLAAAGAMGVHALAATLMVAAVLGSAVNYAIGSYLGPKVFHYPDSRLFNKAYLERTHRFFEKHGGKTIVLARFLPIVRTFAPFVAGIGRMPWRRFLVYNALGGISWVALLLYAGYFFGNVPFVRQNLAWVILGIVVLSLTPGVVEFLRQRAR